VLRPDTFNLKSKRSRASLPVDTNPYYVPVKRGLALGYRKNAKDGTWSFRRYQAGKYSYHVPDGVADDEKDANGERVFSYQQAVDAAVKWDAEQAGLEIGGAIPVGAYTVADCMADYFKARKLETGKDTYRDETTAKAFIYPALGAVPLKKLTHGQLRHWKDGLAGLPPRKRSKTGKEPAYRAGNGDSADDADTLRKRRASVNRIASVLRAGLNFGLAERKVATDNAWKIALRPYRNVDVAKTRWLDVDECKRFLEKCAASFADVVRGALYTGCRWSELTRLQVKDFNEADANVYIAESKNGESRYVQLNAEAVAFFKSLTAGKAPTAKVFLKDGKRGWNQSEQKRFCDAACEASGVKDVTFHILRHSYATLALKNGMDLNTLRGQLGHKKIQMTLRYAKLVAEHQKQQAIQFAPSFGFVPTNSAAAGTQG